MGGITAVAGIRAAQLVLGPKNILFTGLQLALLPSAVAQRDTDISQLRRPLWMLSAILGGLSLLVGWVVALMPTSVLALVVGDQADGLAQYVLPVAAVLAGSGSILSSHIGLRVLRAGRDLLATRLVGSLVTLAGGAVGYVVWQTPMTGLWGLAVGGFWRSGCGSGRSRARCVVRSPRSSTAAKPPSARPSCWYATSCLTAALFAGLHPEPCLVLVTWSAFITSVTDWATFAAARVRSRTAMPPNGVEPRPVTRFAPDDPRSGLDVSDTNSKTRTFRA